MNEQVLVMNLSKTLSKDSGRESRTQRIIWVDRFATARESQNIMEFRSSVLVIHVVNLNNKLLPSICVRLIDVPLHHTVLQSEDLVAGGQKSTGLSKRIKAR